MVFKGKIYISGPRMGTNIFPKGLETPKKKTKKKNKKRKK